MDIQSLLGACDELSIESSNWFSVPQDVDSHSLSLMRGAPEGSVIPPLRDVRGIRYVEYDDTKFGTFIARGAIWRSMRTNEVSYFLRVAFSWSPFSPEIQEVHDTMDNFLRIAPSFDILRVKCVAVYENLPDDPELESRIDLPVPLLLSEPYTDDGVTHIEAITLSRREQDGPPHRTVHIERNHDGTTHHRVEINFTSYLTELAIGQMRAVTDRTSRSLLVPRRQHDG